MKKISVALYSLLMNSRVGRLLLNKRFKNRYNNSAQYWENRYLNNGNSGSGSYGEHATYKALVLNNFVLENHISKVIEWGCGDSNQLSLFKFPSYIGIDVSVTAIAQCRNKFNKDRSKKFFLSSDINTFLDSAVAKPDLSLSLDVIYHLIEDDTFQMYMHNLFESSGKFVIIYAWDIEGEKKFHVRHRNFTSWISTYKTGWNLIERIPKNEAGFCDFFIYKKN